MRCSCCFACSSSSSSAALAILSATTSEALFGPFMLILGASINNDASLGSPHCGQALRRLACL
eukprot:113428-Pyramimonas_sp.AAC.1